MNRKLIIRILGAILCIEAAAMIPSLVISFIHRDGDTAALALSLAACAFLGCPMLCFVKTDKNVHLRLKEGFIITALGWILLSLFRALPFLFSGVLPRFEDAFFEAVSGFTTTGASVVTEFEGFPRGVMLWRASTHWVGGMGVLVLTLALLPKLTGRSAHLVKAESPGPSLSKLVPKTGATAKILYTIYFALTLAEFVTLMLLGLNPYDAAIHAMATAGTGGFSNYGASVAAFSSVPVEMAVAFFMFLFGINFALYYRFFIGEHFKAFFKDEEFRWYLAIAVSAILAVSLINLSFYQGDFWTSLRYSVFTICSTMSTTGFVVLDYSVWPAASLMIVVLIMFVGSCAGSTAGGIKVIRINMIAKLSRRNIRATGQPKKMEVIRIDGKAVEEGILSQVAQFALMYVALWLLGAFIMSFDGRYDLLTHLTASLTCISNVGPGLGAVGPAYNFAGYGILAKVTGAFLMLFGRLELLPMFILFTRSAWHKY